MIDVTSESLLLPTEVTKILPKQKGKTNVSTVYRWMQCGLRGVRLEYVCIGGTRFTSKEALNRFFANVTQEARNIDCQMAKSRSSAAQRANVELEKAGL